MIERQADEDQHHSRPTLAIILDDGKRSVAPRRVLGADPYLDRSV